MNDDIVIFNNAFTGKYGKEDSNNLPHEFVNFLQADDDKYYIYITPYGTINKDVSLDKIKVILFYSSVGEGVVEITGKATGPFLAVDNPQNIKYGKVSLQEINRLNTKDSKSHLTMCAQSIYAPTRSIFVTLKGEGKYFSTLNPINFQGLKKLTNEKVEKINNTSMISYCKYDSVTENFKNFINNSGCWKPVEKFDSIKINGFTDNFFSITKRQNKENMFSDMLCYLFASNKQLLAEFCESVLKINKPIDYKLEREKNRMDLRIISENSYIIIENKIKSDINGLEYKDDSKTKYKTDNKGKLISQLSKYYEVALNEMNRDCNKVKCFILKPNYNPLCEKDLEDKYSHGDKYKIITYKEISDFLTSSNRLKANENNYFYLDFINAIQKHTQDFDNEFRNIVMNRLKTRIEKIKTKSNS